MRKNIINGLSFYFFGHLKTHKELYHAVSTRQGGQSSAPYHSLNLGINTEDLPENIISNHLKISRALNFNLSGLVSSTQVHQDKILSLKKKPGKENATALGSCYHGFDSIITNQSETTLLIRIADCAPILIYDPELKVTAVVHAGWKGTVLKIASKTINKMINEFGCLPENIKAGIGPSIGKCCYPVNNKIADQFRSGLEEHKCFVEDINTSPHINLKEANRIQLILAGVREGNIETAEFCTSCSSNIFFSHRREKGRTGRFALLAGLRTSG